MQAARGGGGGGRAVVGGALTPLMIAARANQLDVMKLLVAAGADPQLRADNGSTTLMYARRGEICRRSCTRTRSTRTSMWSTSPARRRSTRRSAAERRGRRTKSSRSFNSSPTRAPSSTSSTPRDARPIAIADIGPIDKAVDLLTALILKSRQYAEDPSKR